MISINGDEVTERDVEYGVMQYNSDMSTRYMACDDKEDAERIAKGFGGMLVQRYIYAGSWHFA